MNLPLGWRLSHECPPLASDCEAVDDALTEFNKAFLADTTFAHFSLFVRDQTDTVHAGLDAYVYAGWLHVHNLWVEARLRRGGIGRGLMQEAERRALAFGCHSAWLDTFTFQAPGFYEKLGYREFGRLDYPPRHQRVFLKKELRAEQVDGDMQ